jgi:hypothetical protein
MAFLRLLVHASPQEEYPAHTRTGNPMANRIASYFALAFVAGCATSGLINPPPVPSTPNASANVRIHRHVTGNAVLEDVTFTIHDEPIYRFGHTKTFAFVMDPGEYLFGYVQGGKRCSTDVQIDAGGNYVFDLMPNCVIELEKQ